MDIKELIENALRAEAQGVPVDFRAIVVNLYNSLVQQAQEAESQEDGEG
jgi:hypothetical protein